MCARELSSMFRATSAARVHLYDADLWHICDMMTRIAVAMLTDCHVLMMLLCNELGWWRTQIGEMFHKHKE